jgi:CRP-like cAMP-binding protein
VEPKIKTEAASSPRLEMEIQAHPFGQHFCTEHVRTLSECAQARVLALGEHLWRQGEQSRACFLIQAGQVALEIRVPNRGTIGVDLIREGEALGWSGLIEPYRWRYDARAITTVRLLALDSERLRAKCEQDHEFGYQLLRRCAPLVSQRLDSARLKLIDFYGERTP